MINLFEYKNSVELKDSFNELEEFLDEVWINREKNPYYYNEEESKIESQRFLQFLHKSGEIKSNKYVGVIHFGEHKINLLPKIFFDPDKDYSSPENISEIGQMQKHILWWLSYCRKIKFPNYKTSIGGFKSDFFEVLIYLFSKYTRELLNNSIYQQYEDVNSELSFIKGRLNTSKYITDNLSKARWHKLNCSYDTFVFDNKFNRIIKYVSTLLCNVTSIQENKKNLREILFILDEVSDVRATAEQCQSIQFNPIFEEFVTVRDYCHLFLSNSISFDYKDDLKLFAFLLPMEYVFEDFIFGFIEKEMQSITAKAQRSDTYLVEGDKFMLKPDLFLKYENKNGKKKSVVADTKYKIVYSDDKDPKKGISQNDLYQMLAYAVRFNVEDVVLFYPNTVIEHQECNTRMVIEDKLAVDKKIVINAYQLPVLDKNVLLMKEDFDTDLNTLFEPTKNKLIERIENILLDEF